MSQQRPNISIYFFFLPSIVLLMRTLLLQSHRRLLIQGFPPMKNTSHWVSVTHTHTPRPPERWWVLSPRTRENICDGRNCSHLAPKPTVVWWGSSGSSLKGSIWTKVMFGVLMASCACVFCGFNWPHLLAEPLVAL